MPILLSYAQQHELLPNLEILRLTAEQGRKTQSLLWAHVFASQSVREIWFLPNPHYKSPLITISDISALIKMIVQRCQRIQTLGIFAEYDSLVQHQVQQPHSLFASQDHELLANTLAHATSLTRLAGNTMLLERGVFATLGRLPLLSDLEMYCTPRGWTRNVQHSDHALLSDGAFPLLRRLSLCDASEQHLDFIWDSPTLVARLDALEISLSIPINRPTVDMLMSHIPLLCQNGPQLTRLALDFGPGGHKGSQYAICVITQDIFECLVHLPLTELVISRAGLDHKVSDNRLAGAWPDMEVFIWTARWVPLPGLWLFAKYMPKLRHLALEIELVPLSEETALVGAALFCNSMLRALEGGFYQLHRYTADEAYELHRCVRIQKKALVIYMFFRYLSALYPKAHLENWLDKHTEALSRWKPHEHLLRFLNIFSATTCDEPIDAEAKRSLFKRQWDMAMTEGE